MLIQDFCISLNSDSPWLQGLWVPWSKSTLSGLGSFLEYGLSSVVIECSQWWSLELLIFFLSFQKSQVESDAQGVVYNVFTCIYMIPIGMSYTMSALIGTYIAEGGANSIHNHTNSGRANKYTKIAIRYATLCFLYGMFCVTVFTILFCLYSDRILEFFVP